MSATLTHAQLTERRQELASVEEQLRALGRRRTLLKQEILSGYVVPEKKPANRQLSLPVEEAPAQPPEAPAAPPVAPLRDRVRAALQTAKVRRSARVLATLLGESEEDVADELEGLELAREVISKNTSAKAGRAYQLRERWEAKRKRPEKLKKAPKKPAPKKGEKALWKPGYKAGILPSLTAEGNRRALEMIAAAPGQKMLTSEVRAALDLPEDCCTPNGCYYQGSQAGGDWWGISSSGAETLAKPRKASTKKPKGRKPVGKPPVPPAVPATGHAQQVLRGWLHSRLAHTGPMSIDQLCAAAPAFHREDLVGTVHLLLACDLVMEWEQDSYAAAENLTGRSLDALVLDNIADALIDEPMTSAALASALSVQHAIVWDLLVELRDQGRVARQGELWRLATAQDRTTALFPGVEPAPSRKEAAE